MTTRQPKKRKSSRIERRFSGNPYRMHHHHPKVTVCRDNTTCDVEAACHHDGNDKYSCYCTHTNQPVPPDGNCKRAVVTEIPPPILRPDTFSDHLNSTTIQGVPVYSSTTLGPSSDASQNFAIIVSLCTAFLLLVVATTFCFIKRRTLKRYLHYNSQSGKHNQKVQPMSGSGGMMLNGELLLPSERFVMNPTYETSSLVDLAIPIFLSTEINILAQIGQGCFGKVFKGELSGGLVAVKVVKKEHAGDAMKEVETMAAFSHPNILRMVGIAKHEAEEAPWLVFEFMEYGDLASVLRSTSTRLGTSESLEQKPLLTQESLFDVAYQVAEGMKYLSSQHFIHRDLAARNCLVGSNGVVKISDFGLSRDVYTCDYYKIGGSRLLPVRWMSPESVLYGRFTLESDVWAYGILLWEIYTWGKQPYYGHSNEEVVQLILDGVLLCPPSDCPLAIRELMAGCWKSDPKDRLKFQLIIDKFLKTFKEAQMSDTTGTDDYEVPKPKSRLEYMQVV